MRARPLPHSATKPLRMRVRGADGVVAASRQAPAHDFSHVVDALCGHPVQDAGPEAVRGGGVLACGGAVGCAGDVDDDGGPAAGEEFVRAGGVVWAVAVEAAHEDYRWAGFVFGGGFGDADVEGDFLSFILGCTGCVGDGDVFYGCFEERGSFHVGGLLRSVGFSFDFAVDIREAGNAVYGAGAQIEVYLLFLVMGRVGFLDKTFGDGEELFGVLFAIAIVDVLFDKSLKDGGEVFIFAVMEGVERAFAGELPPAYQSSASVAGSDGGCWTYFLFHRADMDSR